MLKAKHKIRSILLVCLAMLATVILGLGSLFSMSKSTASAETTEIVFELGANGTASHSDGSDASTYSETVNGYTLSITGGTKMYTGARDAKGNSCIKLGTSSVVGSFQFTVPDDVTSVVIYVAKYKTNATNIKVHNTSYALTKNSNDGAYDEITVDTSSTKTVTFTTVSGGYRAMVNTIKYVIESSDEPESSDTEEATTYTVTYDVPDGVTAPEAVEVTNGYTTALPAADDYQKYTFAGWVTKTLEGDTNTAPEFMKAGYEYTVTADVTLYALYTYTKENAEEAWNLVTDASFLAVGKEIVIVASGSNYALGATQNSSNRTAVAITKSNNTVTWTKDVQVITLEEGLATGTWAFHVTGGTGTNATNGYLYATATGNHLRTQTSITNNSSWNISITAAGIATIKANVSSGQNWLRKNSSSALFACYESGQKDVSIYMKGDTTYYVTEFNTCAHTNTSEVIEKATCTESGSRTVTCLDCEAQIEAEILPANGHVFVDGACSTCGVEQPKKATLTFDDTSKRKDFSSSQQMWTENGVTVTNAKGSSTTNVADYSNPVRFYKNSTVTIEYPGMLIVEIVANSNSYATALENSIDNTTVQVNGSTVTIIFTEAQDSYTFTCSEQIRINAITAYTTTANIDSASITVGENLTLNYYVTMPAYFATAQMHFTIDGETYLVDGAPAGGRYVFSFEIPPHYIAENIKAELIFNELTIAQKAEYSIKTYTDNQLAKVEGSADEKDIQLKNLLNAITNYGETAANYKAETNTAGENVISESVNEFSLENADGVTEFGVWFTGANVWFDNTNKIMVQISATENVTLTINGAEVEVTGTTIYTNELLPTQFDDIYTFALYYDGELMQTLTYSVNSYAYRMQTNEKIGALAIALYNYGVAAEAYNS